MKESYIESYLVRKVKEHGGLCYKFAELMSSREGYSRA